MGKHADTLSAREAIALLAAALVLGSVAVSGQNAQPQAPSGATAASAKPGPKFEVASVRQNKTGDQDSRAQTQPGGRYTATNITLRSLIRSAYQLQDFQLVAPDWIASERFDISARAASDIPPSPPGTAGPIQLMIRSLLEERFKLVVHRESRELPIYALVLARSDAKLGPKLTPSTVDCLARSGAAGASGAPLVQGQRPVCGMMTGRDQILGGGRPLSQLATSLSVVVQRVVIDRTGLTGDYDLELTFASQQMNTPPSGAPLPSADSDRPSIFTALQEQLGLKLDAQRGPVDVLVIDRVERPTVD